MIINLHPTSTNKKSVFLLSLLLLLPLSLCAQRDVEVLSLRNPLMISQNAALYTTYGDSSIVWGDVTANSNYIPHTSNPSPETPNLQPPTTKGITASANTVYVLGGDRGRRCVINGSIEYENSSMENATGSALLSSLYDDLLPFDIDEPSDYPARKHLERFRMKGAAGLDIGKGYTLGALIDCTLSSYDRQRDLRHSNSLMDLSASLGMRKGVAALAFYYRRSRESVAFEGSEVFASTIKQPLVSEYVGVNATVMPDDNSFLDVLYAHRHGSYGNDGLYSLPLTQHSGDILRLHANYHCFDFYLNLDRLSNDLTTTDNGVPHHTLYQPTKTAEKALISSAIEYSNSFGERGDIATWIVYAGLNVRSARETGYMCSEKLTATTTSCIPYLWLQRLFKLPFGVLFARLASNYTISSSDAPDMLVLNPSIKYDFPLRHTSIRPSISFGYNYTHATRRSSLLDYNTEHQFSLSLGITY